LIRWLEIYIYLLPIQTQVPICQQTDAYFPMISDFNIYADEKANTFLKMAD